MQVLQHGIDGLEGQLGGPAALAFVGSHPQAGSREVYDRPVPQISNATDACRAYFRKPGFLHEAPQVIQHPRSCIPCFS